MILRRYGRNVLSVTPNFDSRAMTEIGFMRDGKFSLPFEEFQEQYERTGGSELSAVENGDVQGDVEDAVLRAIREQLEAVEASAGAGSVVLVENDADQAKTRGTQTTIVVGGENRLRFQYSVDPPLRVGIYRHKG
jgi:hypothetical protein